MVDMSRLNPGLDGHEDQHRSVVGSALALAEPNSGHARCQARTSPAPQLICVPCWDCSLVVGRKGGSGPDLIQVDRIREAFKNLFCPSRRLDFTMNSPKKTRKMLYYSRRMTWERSRACGTGESCATLLDDLHLCRHKQDLRAFTVCDPRKATDTICRNAQLDRIAASPKASASSLSKTPGCAIRLCLGT